MKVRRRFSPIRKSFAKGMADDSARPISENPICGEGQMEIKLHGNHPAEVVFNEVLARLFKKHGEWVSMS
jgi:hypothetical protein